MSAPPAKLRAAKSEAPALRVVRRRSRNLIKRDKARRLAPLSIACAIAVAAIVFGVLLEQVVLGQSAFKLAGLRERVDRAEARHEELLLHAAKLESPGRIEDFARSALGMVDPQALEYIVADVPTSGARVARAPRRRASASPDSAAVGSAAEVIP